jgi:hypothetical protein
MYNEEQQNTSLYKATPEGEQEAYHEIHARRTPGHWPPDL